MADAWYQGGNVVVNAGGAVVVCDDCPCGCTTCNAETIESSTVTVAMSGWNDGWDPDAFPALTTPGPCTGCDAFNGTFVLDYDTDGTVGALLSEYVSPGSIWGLPGAKNCIWVYSDETAICSDCDCDDADVYEPPAGVYIVVVLNYYDGETTLCIGAGATLIGALAGAVALAELDSPSNFFPWGFSLGGLYYWSFTGRISCDDGSVYSIADGPVGGGGANGSSGYYNGGFTTGAATSYQNGYYDCRFGQESSGSYRSVPVTCSITFNT